MQPRALMSMTKLTRNRVSYLKAKYAATRLVNCVPTSAEPATRNPDGRLEYLWVTNHP